MNKRDLTTNLRRQGYAGQEGTPACPPDASGAGRKRRSRRALRKLFAERVVRAMRIGDEVEDIALGRKS